MQGRIRVYPANISWSSRHLEDMPSGDKCLLEISVSNHSLLTNLNQYLTNLYLINLYVMNPRQTQNALIRAQ